MKKFELIEGPIETPWFWCIQGKPGVGKTTFGCQMPDPVFEACERGTELKGIARMPEAESFQDVLDHVDSLIDNDYGKKSYVVDTIDSMAPLVHEAVYRKMGWKPNEATYGKEWAAYASMWRQFFKKLEQLQKKRRMHILLLAHVEDKKYADPLAGDYTRYEIKIDRGGAQLIRETCDVVGYAMKHTTVEKAKAFTTGRRTLHLEWAPQYDAKCRYENVAPKCEFTYQALVNAIEEGKKHERKSDTRTSRSARRDGDRGQVQVGDEPKR